jgi:hypothetical protein
MDYAFSAKRNSAGTATSAILEQVRQEELELPLNLSCLSEAVY